MSDVNTFIDTIGKDISATVSPRIERLAKDYGDDVSRSTGRASRRLPASSRRT
jgi:hypothetical protein